MENEAVDDDNRIAEVVITLANFEGLGKNQLSFNEGDQLNVRMKNDANWWWAEKDGCYGYIPVNHIVGKEDSKARDIWWQDDQYYNNYGKLKLHREMLTDKHRTEAYMKAIQKHHQCCFRGKIVLDVGCGTGILSMFATKYGSAEKVYVVEASDMAEHSKKLVKCNGLHDKIQVINSTIEIADLSEKVDIIISEWMGTFLLFEYMIESVLRARDLYLKETGTIWPSSATLFIVPCSANEEYQDKISFWDEQYGFNFSPLRELAKEEFLSAPVITRVLKQSDCLSVPRDNIHIDLKTVELEHLDKFEHEFSYVILKQGTFHGFGTWFQVTFGDECKTDNLVLDTGPEETETHWKQALLLMDEPVLVSMGDRIHGNIQVTRNSEWPRHLHVKLKFEI